MFGRARIKLALWFAGALAITVAVIGSVAFFVMRDQLDRDINSSIRGSAQSLQGTDLMDSLPVSTTLPDSKDKKDKKDKHDDENDHGSIVATDVFFVLTTRSGDVLSNPRQVSLKDMPLKDLARDASKSGSAMQEFTADGHHYRVLTQPATASGAAVYLHVGRSLDSRDSQLRALTMTLLFGGLAGVVVAGAGGLWLAGRALVPIRSALETQRRFVSDASHELRTPIAVIKANNEILLRHPGDPIESALDQVEAVDAEADHMSHLVDDLLTLARADEGRAMLHVEPLDLGEIVDEVGRDMAALAELRQVTLAIHASPAPVEGDRKRLRQLAVILIDNALKYTPAGGTVTVRAGRAGKRAEISVQDTGPGIAAEHHKRIFDRFYRLDPARTRSVGGTGLGLAIANWIASAHHGRISLESAVGKGSTFTLRLPVKA